MGFSLKMFFEDLQDIFDDPFVSDSQKLEILKITIDANKEYAKECGQLK